MAGPKRVASAETWSSAQARAGLGEGLEQEDGGLKALDTPDRAVL